MMTLGVYTARSSIDCSYGMIRSCMISTEKRVAQSLCNSRASCYMRHVLDVLNNIEHERAYTDATNLQTISRVFESRESFKHVYVETRKETG